MSDALVVTRHGGREVLAVRDLPDPTPGPGEVLVEVAAAGVNFIDVYEREGSYPLPAPFVLCQEGAGTVVATGRGVELGSRSPRVAWAMVRGAAARYAVVPAASIVPVPDDVPLDIAAAAMLQGMTAHYLAFSSFPTGPGTTALVHAAAGGVGQLLVQALKARGAQVIATAGSPEKCRTALRRGADHAIDYTEQPDIATLVRELTGGRGVDVVYDGVGASTFDASLASLRPRGLLVVYGAASGPVPPFDLQRLNAAGSVYLTRPSLSAYIRTRDELLDRAGTVLSAIAGHTLDVEIGGRFPLTEAAAAYELLENRRTQGKLLLIPNGGSA